MKPEQMVAGAGSNPHNVILDEQIDLAITEELGSSGTKQDRESLYGGSSQFLVERMMTGDSRCANVGKKGTEKKQLKTCKGCESVKYCEQQCQKKKWKFHKTVCGKPAQGAAKGDGTNEEDGVTIDEAAGRESVGALENLADGAQANVATVDKAPGETVDEFAENLRRKFGKARFVIVSILTARHQFLERTLEREVLQADLVLGK